MVSDGKVDPKDILRLCFEGSTTKHPNRPATTLSKMIGWGIINGGRIDPRLGILTGYSKEYGPAYIGQLVADALVEGHLADPNDVSDMRFDSLWDALRGPNWKKNVDFYNQLLVELVRQGPCGGAKHNMQVAPVAKARVWKDVLNNQRLPSLITAIFEGLGIPHEGPESLSALLSGMNAFISYHGGVSARQTAALLDAGAEYMQGVLGEASVLIETARDPTNLEAPAPTTFLRATGTTIGARRAWAETCKNTVNANKLRREFSLLDAMPTSIQGIGVDQFSYHADGGDTQPLTPKREREDGTGSDKSRRQKAKERAQERTNTGGGKDIGGAKTIGGTKRAEGDDANPRQQLDYSNASVSFENQGKVLVVGPSTTGQYTKYDAAKMREVLGDKVCLPYLCTVGLLNCKNGCLKQGDPAHQAGGVLHTWPAGAPKRSEFNLKRAADKGKGKGGGKGKESGKGKDSGKGKGKGKAKGSM